MKIDGDDVRYVAAEDTSSFVAVAHWSRYLFVRNQLHLSGKDVLDFGCGSGYGSQYLAEQARQVDGVDYSRQAIEQAASSYQSSRLKFHQLDASSNLSESVLAGRVYDLVVSFDVIEHVERYFHYLHNTTKLLKHEGALIIGCPNRLQLFEYNRVWNPYHVQEFTPRQFKDVLSMYYDEVEIYSQSFANEAARLAAIAKPPGTRELACDLVKSALPCGLKRAINTAKSGLPREFKKAIKRHLPTRVRTFEVSDISITKAGDLNSLGKGVFGLIAICRIPSPKFELPRDH